MTPLPDPSVTHLARQIARIDRRVTAISASPRLSHSSLEDATIDEFDQQGNLVARYGKQPDGTHGTVVVDGPPPPAPTGLTVEGGIASLIIDWSGAFVDGAPPAGDHKSVEVYAAEADFTTTGQAMRVGVLPADDGGRLTVGRPPGDWYVALVTLSLAGKRSEVSERVVGTAESVVDTAILDELEGALATLTGTTLPALTDRVTEAEAAAQAAHVLAGDATAAATAALGSATHAARNLFSTELPTGTAPHGTLWFQTDETGRVIGQWQQTAGNPPKADGTGGADGAYWERREITGAIIANLDAGKITSGTVATARLDAVEVAAAVGTFLDLAAEQITSGKIATARLDVQDIWAAKVAAQQVTAADIDTLSLAADAAFIAELSAVIVTADIFTGREFIGGTFTGATFRSGAGNPHLVMTETGLVATNPDGSENFRFTPGESMHFIVQPGYEPVRYTGGDKFVPGILRFTHTDTPWTGTVGWAKSQDGSIDHFRFGLGDTVSDWADRMTIDINEFGISLKANKGTGQSRIDLTTGVLGIVASTSGALALSAKRNITIDSDEDFIVGDNRLIVTPAGRTELNGSSVVANIPVFIRGGLRFGTGYRYAEFSASWTLPGDTSRLSGNWSLVRSVDGDPVIVSGSNLTVREAGVYTFTMRCKWGFRLGYAQRGHIQIRASMGILARVPMGQEDWGALSWTGYLAAGQSVVGESYHTSPSTTTHDWTAYVLRHS